MVTKEETKQRFDEKSVLRSYCKRFYKTLVIRLNIYKRIVYISLYKHEWIFDYNYFCYTNVKIS